MNSWIINIFVWKKNRIRIFFPGILDSNGADASQIAAALKKSARKKRGGIIGGSLPSVGLDQDETQEIIIKEEEPSASSISTPGKVHSF